MQTIFDGRVGIDPFSFFIPRSGATRDLLSFNATEKQIPRFARDDRLVKRAHFFDDLAPAPYFAARGWQRFQQPATVALRHDARIGDDDHAAVRAAANQSAEALLETKGGM